MAEVVNDIDYNPNYFETFREAIAMGHLEPARNNLYEFRMRMPLCMLPAQEGQVGAGVPNLAWLKADSGGNNIRKNMNLFANNITIPSRNVTTSEVHVHGMNRSYASGQSPTDLDITFLVTKDNQHRAFFEQWMHNCASDSDNTVGFYDQYVCEVDIVKWESGSNSWLTKVVQEGATERMMKFRMNQATAVYRCFGVFPKNIGTLSLNNEARSIMELSVSFQMERYRFDTVNVDGLKSTTPKREYTASEIPNPGSFQRYGV